ncbi:MAG: acetyltransferase [Alphaproteobacteria bacterium]|nr:MAG: acetyltransferase [Alphaproteobacteria bacterium]
MKIVLIGAGGHAKVVLDTVISTKLHEIVALIDDNPGLNGSFLFDIPIFNQLESCGNIQGYIVAIGDNYIRKTKFEFYKSKGYSPVTGIHKSVIISPYANIGDGTVAFANVVVNPGAQIADNVILYTACTVDHDCMIFDHAYISPGCNISGRVNIGTGAFLGTGAVVLPGVKIGDWSIIGAGAVVTKDIPPHVTAVGVPARIIKHHQELKI